MDSNGDFDGGFDGGFDEELSGDSSGAAAPQVEVLQGVLVLGVAVEGSDVLVDVYGSTSHVCGSVRFTFDSAKRRRAMADLLRRWARESTPVTFIQTGSSIALQNDAAVFGSQLESAP